MPPFLTSWMLKRRLARARQKLFRHSPTSVHFVLKPPSLFPDGDLWWELHRAVNRWGSDLADHPSSQLFNALFQTTDLGVVDFDITQLDGLNANNSDWGHLMDFAFRNFRHDYDGGRAIRFKTDKDFEWNKEEFREAILHPNATVTWSEWDDRYYLRNSGRGHHTAAIFRQCLADGRNYSFPAKLESRCLDRDVIRQLESYWIVVCDGGSAAYASNFEHDFNPRGAWSERWISFDLDLRSASRFERGPHLLFIKRSSKAFSTAEEWLKSVPGAYWDLSVYLQAYLPSVRRNPLGRFPAYDSGGNVAGRNSPDKKFA